MLAEASFDSVNLAVVDWSEVRRLADELDADRAAGHAMAATRGASGLWESVSRGGAGVPLARAGPARRGWPRTPRASATAPK